MKPSRKAPRYLAYVRTHDCCSCVRGTPIEAHHFGPGGMGLKADDFHAVPLCRGCHRYFHDTGFLPGSNRIETVSTFYETQARLLVAWLRRERASDETTSADEAF